MTQTIAFPADGFNQLKICRFGPTLFNRNDAYVGRSLDLYGEYGPAEAALFAQIVQPGMWVVEVGANIGAHTVHLSRMAGEDGRVIAFEPQRLPFQTLCANIALSSRTNVHAYQMGLGHEAGEASEVLLDPTAAINFGGVSLQGAQSGTHPLLRVPVQTLDSFALPVCHFLKIDVEGMELAVLQGARATLARCRPIVFLENDRKAKSADLIGFMSSCGYDAYWIYTPLFSPDNFERNGRNVFPGITSISLICVPGESGLVMQGFGKVTGPDDVGLDIWSVA